MPFHSVYYLMFLSGVVLAYYTTPPCSRWITLLVANCAFYGSWRVEFIVVLFAVIALQYLLALRMARQANESARRWHLFGSLALGLGVLIYFKYTIAFRDLLGLSASSPGPVAVPIGISFYTLQIIGYLIDVYYGRREPEMHFGRFVVFVSFFPIVLSGPIERSDHLLPQLQKTERSAARYNDISAGVKLLIWGFFLKLVIADRTALYVDAVFGHPERHSGLTFAVATVFYSFQIYCDFAGYSSVAIGSAKLLGIDILQNFRHPYLAVSIRDFWRRWHITLSTWFRDYVFLPLAYALSELKPDQRAETVRLAIYGIATFATFALCGLWHGPQVGFLVWGALHGLYLGLENSVRIDSRYRLVNIGRTYALVLISFVFFRAATVSDALAILSKMATAPGHLYIPGGPDVVAPLYAIAGIALLIIIELKREFYPGKWSVFGHRNDYVRVLAYSMMVAIIISMGVFDGGQFIYAQF
jgi:alginate O-acetyltransferase complex protein AlgI